MAQPLNVRTDNAEFIYNTAAWFAASTIIWTPSQILVPVDGDDAGKHKFGNNVDTYSDLDFFEDVVGAGSVGFGDITGHPSDNNALQDNLTTLSNAITAEEGARITADTALDLAKLSTDGDGSDVTVPDGTVVVVSGAGTTAANGIWLNVGTNDGKNKYAKEGTVPGSGDGDMEWNSDFGQWRIVTGGEFRYYSEEDVATPDLTTTWVNTGDGIDPVPTVSAGTQTLEELAGEVSYARFYSATVQTADPPVVTNEVNTIGGTPAWTTGGGTGEANLSLADIPANASIQVTSATSAEPFFVAGRIPAAAAAIVNSWDFDGIGAVSTVNVLITIP